MIRRVGVYIDGFKLYFGIRQKRWRDVLWLDLEKFASAIIRPGNSLEYVKYFTAMVSGPPDKHKRQEVFIEALKTLPKVTTYLGKYESEKRLCPVCGATHLVPREKMTDVNIATEILADAYENRFDLGILVGADSDLVPPLAAVRRIFPRKRILIAFPPGRYSKHLGQIAHGSFRVSRTILLASQFPDMVVSLDGFRLDRPKNWC